VAPRSTVALVAFDLDGTLLRGRTVCEAIAARLGRLERMRAIEDLRERSLVEAGREEMRAWYEGRTPAWLCEDLPGTALAPGATEAFSILRSRGVATAIVSITWSFAVAHFARLLSADAFVGTELNVGGPIGHFWPEDKPRWLKAHAARAGLSLAQVAAVGDSRGDVPMLEAVGRGVFVGRERIALCTGGAAHLPGADIREVVDALFA
jgi:phosphoserine phosphatase